MQQARPSVPEKKKRRRKRRNRFINVRRINPSFIPNIKAYIWSCWKDMKRQYRHEQRANMGGLKSVMKKSHLSGSDNKPSGFIKHHMALNVRAAHKDGDAAGEEDEEMQARPLSYLEPHHHSTVTPSKPNDVGDKKLNSADVSRTGKSGEAGPSSKSDSKYKFVSGVIVEVHNLNTKCRRRAMATPPPNSSQGHTLDSCMFSWDHPLPLPRFDLLKKHFSKYGPVAYVDVDPDKKRAVVRFEDASSAQQAILEESLYHLELLIGEKEEEYWYKLLAARELKLAREPRSKRGKDKLTARANKAIDHSSTRHIKFNCDFV